MTDAKFQTYQVIWFNGRRVKFVLVLARNLAHACRLAYSYYSDKKFLLIGAHESRSENSEEPFSITLAKSYGHSEWLERMFESDK